ncbi:DUF2141 domain-containing protein, partial [Cupriavidus sp. CuC1]|uniref:DUF2141 domain-containing protein n=1 Tax=Cupriavidus sp. CuC1 TaxID=3373131 RepID=UPI0037D20D1A
RLVISLIDMPPIRLAEGGLTWVDWGTYSIAAAHDENMNGKLDTNALGIPMEGYGFSNDAKGWLSAPTFSAASFSYDGQNLDMTITLHY